MTENQVSDILQSLPDEHQRCHQAVGGALCLIIWRLVETSGTWTYRQLDAAVAETSAGS